MSNRWKHLIGGLIIGIFALGWFTGVYAGVLTAGALEYKDKAHGGKWDWIDFRFNDSRSLFGMFNWRNFDMEQLSTIIQVIGSLITLVILPLRLIKSKTKKSRFRG